ncbi:hypothetical protein GCM10022393_38430 [Aquimarina addita]|uniref:Uncharacterized protein n=1 Tax=Aquimarina addita TaxID=870485 RepID=A0ABP6UUS1_9FLAO
MKLKTSLTYRNDILEKYHREKGGEMSSYLLEPTRKQIKEACIWLLNRRNEKYDDSILNRFFKFKEGDNKLSVIEEMKSDKFRPIVNFLIGETKSTSPANLELISWLIDFNPRPLCVYLRSDEISDEKKTTKNSIGKKNIFDENYYPVEHIVEIPETKVIHGNNKSITIISQINPNLKITTIVTSI